MHNVCNSVLYHNGGDAQQNVTGLLLERFKAHNPPILFYSILNLFSEQSTFDDCLNEDGKVL
jgi:hypothetical protein